MSSSECKGKIGSILGELDQCDQRDYRRALIAQAVQ